MELPTQVILENFLPNNVTLVYYKDLVEDKQYCILRNDPCLVDDNNRKYLGVFKSNQELKCDEMISRFDNFKNVNDNKTIDNYPTINPLNNDIQQKFYFFERRLLPMGDELKRLKEMRWYVIQKIFNDPEFGKKVFGPGFKFKGSYNISSLKPYFMKY